MPKLVVKFKSSDSLTAELKTDTELQGQGAAYVAVLADMIAMAEVKPDSSLSDSCVILDVEQANSCVVSARYGRLDHPERQLPMLEQYLRAVAISSWTGLGVLQSNVVILGQMMNAIQENMKREQREQEKIILPGMNGFNHPFLS